MNPASPATPPSLATPALPESVARAFLPDAAPVLGDKPLQEFTAWHAILLRRLGNPVLDIIDGRPVLGGDYDAYATAGFILSLAPDKLDQLYAAGRLPAARDQWLRTLGNPVLLVSVAEVVAAHILTPFRDFIPTRHPEADGQKKTNLPTAGSSPSAAPSPEPTASPSAGPSPSPSPKSSSPTPSTPSPEATSSPGRRRLNSKPLNG